MTRRQAPRAVVAAQALRRLLLLSACTCTTPWGSWRGLGSHPVPASASVLLPLERIDLERRVPPHPAGRRALSGRPAAGMDAAESREIEVRSPGGTSIAADDELPVVGVDAGSGRSGLVTSTRPGRGAPTRTSSKGDPYRAPHQIRFTQRRRAGSAPPVAVWGEGLEEAVMGERATVFVEVQGRASPEACGRHVSLRLFRASGQVEHNGTKATCRSLQGPRPSPQTGEPEAAAGNSSLAPPDEGDGQGVRRQSGHLVLRGLRQEGEKEENQVNPRMDAVNGSRSACSIPDQDGACEIYAIDYLTLHWGSFVLIVLVDGIQVPESPFRPFVFPAPQYPWFNSSSLQAPTDDWQHGDQLHFSIVAKNFLAHRVPSCGAHVAAWLHAPDVDVQEGMARPSVNGLALPAVVRCDNTSGSAIYTLTIERVVSDGKWLMSAFMDDHRVLHSPLALTVRPGVSIWSNLTGDGTREAHVGQAAEVILRLIMHNGKPAVDCREPAVLVLVLLEEEAAEPSTLGSACAHRLYVCIAA